VVSTPFARSTVSRLDNLCHTLVGAALGQAGLKRATPLAMATLLVGANLPDVDAVTYVFADAATSFEFRRGWTHGAVAMAVLPLALAGAMAAWDRFVRRRRHPEKAPARFPGLLMLAFLSVLSHPILDFLNTYGVRFLYPFSRRWFYGDALFIVDLWVWIALAVGVGWSAIRRRRRHDHPEGPARAALAATAAYVVGMLLSSAVGRGLVARTAAAHGLSPGRSIVSPQALDPLRRTVSLEVSDGYRLGTLRWLSRPAVSLSAPLIARNDSDPFAVAAARTRDGRKFLVWARFPYFVIERGGYGAVVTIHDARYPGEFGSWAVVRVRVPAGAERMPESGLLRSSP
jgi:inner membrane protein